MQLQEILSQVTGFTPPDVRVKIAKVYPRKSGEGEHGEWSFQDVEVEDNGFKGRLKLKNVDEFDETRAGQIVTLKAFQSPKHGLTGLKVAHEEYQGKTYDKLIVTGTAKWEWMEPSSNGGNGHKPETRVEYDKGSDRQREQSDVQGFEPHLLACAAIAKKLADALGLADDQAKQACFATVCIDAQRHGIILGGDSPTPELERSQGANATSYERKRAALLEGVRKACELLNKEGLRQPMTVRTLGELIEEEFSVEGGVANLENEQVESLLKLLSEKLDIFRANKDLGDDDTPY